MVGASAGGRVDIIAYEPALLPALTRFYRDIWDDTATEAKVAKARAEGARLNPVSPGQEAPTFLFLRGGEVLGHLTTVPGLVQLGETERAGYWFVGFMVRPEHRNGPIGFLLLREAASRLELTFSISVADAATRLFRAVGFADLGVIPNFIRLLRPTNVLRRLDPQALGLGGLPGSVRLALRAGRLPVLAHGAGAGIRLGLGVWSGLQTLTARGAAPVLTSGPDPAALDAAWALARPGLAAAAVRDAAYLARRYGTPEGQYRWVAAPEGNSYEGAAVVRLPRAHGDSRLRGIRVATLSDLIFPLDRPDVGLRVLAGSERAARDAGADGLLASTAHRALVPLLRRRGYLRFPGNLAFLVRDDRGALPGPTTLADWWLNRGDGNADAAF